MRYHHTGSDEVRLCQDRRQGRWGHGYDVVCSDHGGPADEQRAHDAAAEAAHHHKQQRLRAHRHTYIHMYIHQRRRSEEGSGNRAQGTIAHLQPIVAAAAALLGHPHDAGRVDAVGGCGTGKESQSAGQGGSEGAKRAY